jgi:uncharacterized protein YraI
MRRLIGLAVACVLTGVCADALAGEGYTVAPTTLYSAPNPGYPPIETIPVGAQVFVEGCTDGYAWCDVVAGEDRGWMPGNYIQYEYNGAPQLVAGFGAAIGIPIVTFSIADYWGRYYRGRPFWAQHDRWFARPLPYRAPPVYRGPVRDYVHGPVHEAVGHPFAHAPVGGPIHREAPRVEEHREAPRGEEHREERH